MRHKGDICYTNDPKEAAEHGLIRVAYDWYKVDTKTKGTTYLFCRDLDDLSKIVSAEDGWEISNLRKV